MLRSFVFSLFALHCCNAIAAQISGFDSLVIVAQNIKDDSLSVIKLVEVAGTLFYQDKSEADSILDLAQHRAQLSHQAFLIAYVFSAKAQLSLTSDQYEEALLFIDQSNELISQDPIFNQIYLRNLNNQGLVYYYKGDYKEALEFFFRRLSFASDIKNLQVQIRTLNNIGICYERLNSNKDALLYYFKGLTIIESSNYKDLTLTSENQRLYFLAALNENIGAIHIDDNKHTLAKSYILSSYNIGKQINNKPLLCDAAVNLSKVYIESDSLKLAKKYITEAVSLAQKLDQPNRIVTSNLNLAKLLYKQSLYNEGVIILNNIKNIAQDKDIQDQMPAILETLSQSHAAISNYKEALRYSKELAKHRDSIYSEQTINITQELNAKFLSAEKEAEIANQDAIIAKQHIQRNTLLGGLGLTLISFLFLWFRYWSRQKLAIQNQLIQQIKIDKLQQEKQLHAMDFMMQGQEEERKRIAQDLHDGLGGLLTSVKHQIQSIREQVESLAKINIADEAENLISKACEEVRRISHDMMPASLVSLGLIDAIEDLMQEIIEKHPLKVSLSAGENDIVISDKVKVNLFRIIQEALSNSINHANATNCHIILSQSDNSIELEIKDNGIGIDLTKASQKEGIGLQNIESRVQYLNGRLEIDGSDGTWIKIVVPL